MCAIVGIIKNPDEKKVRLWMNSLSHRGPDFSGIYKTFDFCVGHCRLSILGDAREASQPMVSKEGSVLVYNGEIYNCHDLQKKYLGTCFYSDTKILFCLLEKFGSRILAELRGMFSFAFYNAKEQSWLFSRDVFGMKPFFYRKLADGGFEFSSELRIWKQELDCQRLDFFLCFGGIFGEDTLYKGIEKLEPGCFLYYLDGQFQKGCYLKLGEILISAKEKILPSLSRSVSSHLLCDVPLALLLSSGVDSCALASVLPKGFEARTLSFSDSSLDESKDAQRITREFELNHKTLDFSHLDVKKALQGMDTPLGDPSWFASFRLFDAVSGEFKAVLTGDGGDEFCYGYPTFQVHSVIQNFSKNPFQFLSFLANQIPCSKNRVSFWEKLARLCWKSVDMHFQIFSWMSSAPPEIFRKNLFCEEWEEQRAKMKLHGFYQKEYTSLYWYYFRFYLPEIVLVKSDRASMAHGVEVRSPFLDLDYLKSAFRSPQPGWLYSGLKAPLRKELIQKYPHLKNIFLSKKKGFSVPISQIVEEVEKITGIFVPGWMHRWPRLCFNWAILSFFHPQEAKEWARKVRE